MYTYIMYDERYYKIGRTANLENRISTMKTSNPFAQLLFYKEGDVEKELHETYKDKRVKGEWFNLDEGELLALGTTFVPYVKSLKPPKGNKKKRIYKRRYELKDPQETKRKRSEFIVASNKERSKKTFEELLSFVDNWNFYSLGKITQVKLIELSGKNRKTIHRHYPKIKEKINILNSIYLNKHNFTAD